MRTSIRRFLGRGVAAAATLAVLAAAPVSAQDVNWEQYRRQTQAVPRDTISQTAYQGWKQYELNCSRCHGEFGVGSSFAPALTVSLKDEGTIPTQADFVTVVCAGRKEKGMPAWCEAGLEMDKIMNIYEYLKARADGKVGLGRPAVRSGG